MFKNSFLPLECKNPKMDSNDVKNEEDTSMDAAYPDSNEGTKAAISEWKTENNLDPPILIKAYERESSKGTVVELGTAVWKSQHDPLY